MKLQPVKTACLTLLTGACLSILGVANSQAQSTFIKFSVDMGTNIVNGTFNPPPSGTDVVNVRGTYNGWSGTEIQLVQVGSSTVYTNTVNDNTDANGGTVIYIFNINGSTYETTADYNNRAARLPATSNATLVLPTPFFGDAGAAVSNNATFQVDMSQQINLGNFTNNGVQTVEVRGNFNGWAGGVDVLTNNAAIHRTNQFGLVTSNVFVGTFPVVASPNAAIDYKFVYTPPTSFEGVNATNADNGGNRYFANLVNSNQVFAVVDYSDSPYSPIAQVTFTVDMTVVALTDTNFDRTSVSLNGDFNGWSSGLAMTNAVAAKSNIFSVVVAIGEGSSVNYQYRYNELGTGSTVYDHQNGANGGNNNRYVVIPASNNVVLPTVQFNDASLSDYFLTPTAVLFSIDMTNAVGTDGHAFNASSDAIYINGQFANWYAWSGGVNPAPAPAGYQMVEQGLTTIYTNTIVIPAGIPVGFNYKYGIDINSANGGPADDEAGFGQNHFRVARNTAFVPYITPKDTFGNMYGEPFFTSTSTAGGNLTIGAKTNGYTPVSWLGRPGARLQYRTNLSVGAWVEITTTDGTNYTIGHASTNGFTSVTNWSATNVTGKTYFRLVKH